jgi:hypothetical protein
MKNSAWIIKSALVFIISTFVSWFIPDGLNLLSQVLGQGTDEITFFVRYSSSIVGFLFGITIETLAWLKQEAKTNKEEIVESVTSTISISVQKEVNSSILTLILRSLDNNSESASLIQKSVKDFAEPFARVPPDLLYANSIVIEGYIKRFNEDIKSLNSDGCDVSIREHLETNKLLLSTSKSYLQIQRKAFKAPEEWTEQWCQLINSLKDSECKREYIVLMDKISLDKEKNKIESMRKYLQDRGFIFKYCDLKDVLDSLGGNLPTDDNLEVFDEKIVKLHGLPTGVYSGGITLKMTLFDISERDNIRRLIDYVNKLSKPFKLTSTKSSP